MAAEPLVSSARARQKGEAARDVGVGLAARRKAWFVRRDTLRFLDVMMARPDRTATTDDTADDLAGTFADGGRWRGSIPKALAGRGLIAKVGVRSSDRSARHRGYVAMWQAANLAGIERRRDELRRWLAEHPCPAEPAGETLFDDLAGEGGVSHAR